jgi:hypothetical protein
MFPSNPTELGMEPRGEGFTTEPHLSLYFILWDIDFV